MAEHAFRLFELPIHHRDPFDRQIIAQALFEKISIVTPDREFYAYEGLRLSGNGLMQGQRRPQGFAGVQLQGRCITHSRPFNFSTST